MFIAKNNGLLSETTVIAGKAKAADTYGLPSQTTRVAGKAHGTGSLKKFKLARLFKET